MQHKVNSATAVRVSFLLCTIAQQLCRVEGLCPPGQPEYVLAEEHA